MIRALGGSRAATVKKSILDKYVQGFEADGPATYGITPVTDGRGLETLRRAVEAVRVEPKITAYITAVVRGTRDPASLTLGASPRAGVSLLKAARAPPLLESRASVIPDPLQLLPPPAFRP